MKRSTLIFLLLLGLLTAVKAQTGAISGTVYDERKEPIIGAVVQLYQHGISKDGAVTDEDGKYTIKLIQPGNNYELHLKYASYKNVIIKRIVISPDKTTYQNINMEVNTRELEEVVVKEYKIPLINKNNPGSTTFTSEQINRIPSRNTNDVASLSAATYQEKNDASIHIAGARAAGSTYIIDGLQVKSSGQPLYKNPNDESYAKVRENDFMNVQINPLSTLSVDVDRASYSNVRRFIESNEKPPVDAVRIEEMVNYFHYEYPQPEEEHPIAIVSELTNCPWNEQHQLLKIGMQAKTINTKDLPPSNFVFLIDVSGSMSDRNKLPLVKQSMKMLVKQLRAIDKVSIVVYAGSAGLVLPPTQGDNKETIKEAIDHLQSGGSTAGGEGIMLAYKIAGENFIEGGNNRVILATDGDFNVGISADNELESLIVKERRKGIFLTCLGYGMGNYKDSKLETLADKGNGNYSYIDGEEEAEKTLITEFGGTLFTLAKDVKAQIEFNPEKVKSYRLIGYENRMLNEEDFKDDKKDAGEVGSGHQVTILYEIILEGVSTKNTRAATALKYQQTALTKDAATNELATIKFRYKKPDENKSIELDHIIKDGLQNISNCTSDTRFAASVALFGMLLRDSKYVKEGTMDDVISLAKNSIGRDEEGYRDNFIKMAKRADRRLSFSE